MLCGSSVGDDIDRRGVNDVIAVFSGILLERIHGNLKISLRNLADTEPALRASSRSVPSLDTPRSRSCGLMFVRGGELREEPR
jgi:hypothetical protein